MKNQIIGKNITITDGMRNAIEKSLSKLQKYFKSPDDLDCRVVVRSYNNGAKIKVIISGKNIILRAEEYHDDLYAAIDLVIDKLERQMRKVKTRIKNKHQNNNFNYYDLLKEEENSEDEEDEEVRVKTIPSIKLTLDEAITKMESLGYTFFLYLDAEDSRPSVVYKKLDGKYGLLELEEE